MALDSTNTEKETSLEETKIGEILIQGLTEDMVTVLIRACVSMLGVPVDPDTLHATLRLCLRLTRDHKYAMMFAELKSTRMILNLTQSSGFNGFTPLVTLLLRHIIEDPCTLRHTMEKVSLWCPVGFSFMSYFVLLGLRTDRLLVLLWVYSYVLYICSAQQNFPAVSSGACLDMIDNPIE